MGDLHDNVSCDLFRETEFNQVFIWSFKIFYCQINSPEGSELSVEIGHVWSWSKNVFQWMLIIMLLHSCSQVNAVNILLSTKSLVYVLRL